MGPTTTIILVGIVLGTLQLVAGVAIGRYFPFHRRSASPGPRHNASRLETFARRLGHLVGRVSDDVGQHRAQIAQVNRELADLGAGDGTPLAEAVLDAVAQVVDSNVRLQHRLTAAEEKLQRQSEQLQSQLSEARTDPLTELPNRRAFRNELDHQVALWQRRRTPFGLLMVDADHFKGLNDRYGHPAGDHVLQALGETLRGTVRRMDMLARVGGEEFAVILPGATTRETMRVAEAVRKAVEVATFSFEQQELHVTVSLGAAVIGPNDHPVSLIKRADEALYASKRAGRNCAHFHDGVVCRRIPAEQDAAGRRPSSREAPQAAAPDAPGSLDDDATLRTEDAELRTILRDLRARLAEIAGEGEPAAASRAR